MQRIHPGTFPTLVNHFIFIKYAKKKGTIIPYGNLRGRLICPRTLNLTKIVKHLNQDRDQNLQDMYLQILKLMGPLQLINKESFDLIKINRMNLQGTEVMHQNKLLLCNMHMIMQVAHDGKENIINVLAS